MCDVAVASVVVPAASLAIFNMYCSINFIISCLIAVMDKIDKFLREAGGTSLAHDGVFNNAYVLATADSAAARARIAEFNSAFTAWYGKVRRCSDLDTMHRPSVGSARAFPRPCVLPSNSKIWVGAPLIHELHLSFRTPVQDAQRSSWRGS